jgi:HSP20 family protein
MSLVRWEPLREVDDFFRQYAPLFGRLQRRDGGSWTPTADVIETETEYLIKAELPEVKKEDLRIQLENDIITISGERRQEKEAKEENQIRVERSYGSFMRSFSLPSNVDPNGIQAECKDGVLSLHIPKTEEAKPKARAIEVK